MSALNLEVEPLALEPAAIWAGYPYLLETTGNFLILWATYAAIKVTPEQKYSFVAYDRFARQWRGYTLRREDGEPFLSNVIEAADKNAVWFLNSAEGFIAYIDLYTQRVHTVSFSPNFLITLPLNSLKRDVLYLVSGTHDAILKCSVSGDGISYEEVMSLKPDLTPQIANGLHVAPDDEEFFVMTDKGIAYLSRSGSIIELFARDGSDYFHHHKNNFFVIADRDWSRILYTQNPHKGWRRLNLAGLDSITRNHNVFLSLKSFFADDEYVFLTLCDVYDLSSYFLVLHKGDIDAYWEFNSDNINITPWGNVIILSTHRPPTLQSKNDTHRTVPRNNGVLFYDPHQRDFRNESSLLQSMPPTLLICQSLINKYKQNCAHRSAHG